MQVLPSPRFITGALLVVVVGIIGYGTYATLQSRDQARIENASEIVSSVDVALSRDSALQAAATLDTDENGVPDWQEELERTKKVSTESASKAPSQLTLTDEFARAFFTNYINTKELGRAITGEAGDDIALATMDLLRERVSDIIPQALPSGAFETTPTTIDSVRAYGNSVGTILGSSGGSLKEGVGAIFDRAVRNGDQAEMEKLTAYSDALSTQRDQLMLIKVPEAFLEEHRGYVDDTVRAIAAIEAMRGYFADPLSSVVGMQLLSAVRDDMAERVPRIRQLFRDVGVVYTNREPGYIFVMLGQGN